jgi:ureidoglycolate lyase
MRSMKLLPLTDPSFRMVGACHDMFHPEGEKLGDNPVEFFRDMLPLKLGKDTTASFSLCRAQAREPFVDAVEYHTFTEEAIVPLDADIAMAFAPATATGTVPREKMNAYRIPRGTMIVLKTGAWHSGPYVIGKGPAHILVALPERTYANDCIVKVLSDAERLSITGL